MLGIEFGMFVMPVDPKLLPDTKELFDTGLMSSLGAGRGAGALSTKPKPPPVFSGAVLFIWSLFGII